MNIFYYCKKSDRVIGNRDLIANPFFQGYSRSDFDQILDHFLAKWSGFDCQSQKKWSVTTMIFQYWHIQKQKYCRIFFFTYIVLQKMCTYSCIFWNLQICSTFGKNLWTSQNVRYNLKNFNIFKIPICSSTRRKSFWIEIMATVLCTSFSKKN